MITFKPIIIFGNRRKDGTWAVYIRVTFKGATRRVATPLVCTSADLTRSGRIKAGAVLDQAEEIVRPMRKAVAGLSPFDLGGMDVDGVLGVIRSRLQRDSFSLDFFTWADAYITNKTEATRYVYDVALNAFARFLGGRHMDINTITKGTLLDFSEWVGKPNTARRHLALLSHLFGAAKERYNDEDEGVLLIPRSPFGGVRIKPEGVPKGQPALPVGTIQKMIDARPEHPKQRFALDVFLLSFCLMGVNLADLWKALPVAGDLWTFQRSKVQSRTGMIVKAKIWPEVLPYLGRLQGEGEWWLNTLHRYDTRKQCGRVIYMQLHRWCEAEGLEPFSLGAARHTWATLARSLGTDKSVVDDALGHKGSFVLADIYAEKAWNLCWDACRKVLDLFHW